MPAPAPATGHSRLAVRCNAGPPSGARAAAHLQPLRPALPLPLRPLALLAISVATVLTLFSPAAPALAQPGSEAVAPADQWRLPVTVRTVPNGLMLVVGEDHTGAPSGALIEGMGCRPTACTRGSRGDDLGRSQAARCASIALCDAYLCMPTAPSSQVLEPLQITGRFIHEAVPSVELRVVHRPILLLKVNSALRCASLTSGRRASKL